jgi:hypothetical protein
VPGGRKIINRAQVLEIWFTFHFIEKTLETRYSTLVVDRYQHKPYSQKAWTMDHQMGLFKARFQQFQGNRRNYSAQNNLLAIHSI